MLLRGAVAAVALPPPDEIPDEPARASSSRRRPSAPVRPGPRLLWWDIPADSLLHSPSFRALMTMRVATETALNALTYGMLIEIVSHHGASRWVGLLAALVTISTVAPAALFGPIGGVVVDRMPQRVMLILTNLARALLCFGFLFIGSGTVAIYGLLVAITAVTQFATPAEASVLPRVVPQERLAAANSFSNLSESAGQLLGMAILAPVLVKLPGAPQTLIVASGLLLTYAALRAVGVRFSVPATLRPQPPTPLSGGAPFRSPPRGLPAKPWLAGTRAALLEAWQWLAGDRAAFISMMLLVLASTANLVMVTLAPKFTREVIGLSPEFAVFVFGPAVVGMLTGLALVPRLARRVNKRLLVTIGFLLIVALLLLFGALNAVTELLRRLDPLKLYSGPLSWGPLDHADGRLGTALILAVPLGFGFSMVQVAAHTLLHERVPLEMQGRVFALQGAVKNATAILPLLVLGGLASLVGDVRPVMIVAALLILFLALYGGARSAQWTGRPQARLGTAGQAGTEP
jgi:MFS family permease